MTTIILTGGTGYLGSILIEEILASTDWQIISLQRRWSNRHERIRIVPYDLRSPVPPHWTLTDIKYMVHLGARVQALHSLKEPTEFVQTNTMGTLHMLEAARRIKPELFVYMSTAEVLGGREEGYSVEDDLLRPSNPYAASKAAGELLSYSYFRSFDVPAVIVRTMNFFGQTQTDESKFVPMVRKKLIAGEEIQIHVKDGKPGMRQWIRGEEFAKKLLALLGIAKPGETYHICGEEVSNLDMAKRVADELGVTMNWKFVEQPATHSWRYAIKSTK